MQKRITHAAVATLEAKSPDESEALNATRSALEGT